ncbi:hypothetical protein QVD17_37104 [Tagetes erecta]|uniref:Uncharacterized protein n=1 Tax=Tagetes erecta TaxID=13708 RepID=A0AAD8NIW2_TARER|nr:hypothetical protein QVD17_37104 [Tagetes erecta]
MMVMELGVAQASNKTADSNTPLKFFCGSNDVMSPTAFTRNLNSTLSQLRSQLSNSGVYYAKAQSLENGDGVYGIAQCRKYLLSTECLACFDVAVSAVEAPCGSANGAHVFLDNCFLRFENYDQFYDDPQGSDSGGGLGICGNESTSQPITAFNQVVQDLLSDIRLATPKTSDFYTASTTLVTNNNQTINLTPFLDKGSSSKSRMILGVSSSAGLVLLILALFLWFRWHKSKAVGKGARCYSYEELKLATNNFNEEYLLGKGGFGEVFKAIVDGGIVVAVKKFHFGFRAKKEFKNEVNLIGNVRHRNLIRQLGWCVDRTELLLVLEYTPNGSLDKFLWGKKKGTLNWKQRSDIIIGIARGLAHLHEEFHVKIIHRDIKSSNILLDNDFQPKIADFGLARLFSGDQTHVSTRFAGTMGYIAPEYATHGHMSEKVDTYSFGIVALEVISGRSCSDVEYSGPRMEYLLDHAWNLYENGTHMKLVDEAIDPNEYQEENVKKIIETALMCTQSPASIRPTMSQVYLLLSSAPTLEQRQMSRPIFIDVDRRIYI